MNAIDALVLLIPLSLFLSYRQAVRWERRDLLRQVDADYVNRQRRGMEGGR